MTRPGSPADNVVERLLDEAREACPAQTGHGYVYTWQQAAHAVRAALSPQPTGEMEMCDCCNGAGVGVADTVCGKCDGAGGYPAQPTGDVVERVARAIFETQHPSGTTWDGWALYVQRNPGKFDGREESRKLARAAIAALSAGSSEPTREMIEAGFNVLWRTEFAQLGDKPTLYKDAVRAIYLAMTAARKGGGE